MKKNLLIVFILFISMAKSQNLVLTQSAYEPAVGDTSRAYIMDTTYYFAGLPINAGGDGVTWDLSGLVHTETIVTQAYVDPTTLTVSVPSGCNLVQRQGGGNTYLKSAITPTTQTELLGVTFSTINVTFTNTGVIARYPVSYGSSLSDNFSGTVGGSLTVVGNISYNADGRGTLVLPYGNVFNNVLRVRTVQTTTATAFIIPVANIRQYTYQYYHAASKFPLFTVTRSVSTFSNQTTITTQATANKELLVVGLAEQYKQPVPFSFFPNPANSKIYFLYSDADIPEKITLLDMFGKVMLETTNVDELNIEGLQPGVYLVRADKNSKSGYRRLVISR